MDKFVNKRKRPEDTSSDNGSTEGSGTSSKRLKENKPGDNNPDSALSWTQLTGENLDCSHTILYTRSEADELLAECERSLEYFTGHMAEVRVFGKWHSIPRKQTAYGDDGMTYRYSGKSITAKPWTPFLSNIRDRITRATGLSFNFVLINRYKDGQDHIGEHRDDERELVPRHPIASLSLGQPRDFVFKHAQARGKHAARKIPPITVQLRHGSLLLMKYPTNTYWYHSLPPRKTLTQLRINMTFRKMDPSKMVPVV